MVNIKNRFQFLIMIIFLTPTPNVSWGEFLPIITISAYTVWITAENIGIVDKNNFYLTIKKVIFQNKIIILLSIYCLLEVGLLVFQPFSLSNISYIFRPLYFAFIFISMQLTMKDMEKEEVKLTTLRTLKLILLIESFFVVLQLFDINFLSWLYEDTKSFPLGRLVRVTGTFGNPNLFAWYIAQIISFILLFDEDHRRKFLYFLLGSILVLFSGSRTMIVLGPVIWFFVIAIKKLLMTKDMKILLYFMGLMISFAIFTFLFLKITRNIFPYASQLLNVLNGGLAQVSAFDARIVKWRNTVSYITEHPTVWFTGFKSKSYISVDNDILYGISRSGMFGVVLQYLIYFLLFVKSWTKRESNLNFKILILEMLIFTVIIGIQAETITGWIYPVFYVFIYSLLYSEINVNS